MPVAVVCAVVFLLLVVVPSALAATPHGAVAISPPNPVAGDSVTASVGPRECPTSGAPAFTFTFYLDNPNGTRTQVSTSGPQSSESYNATLSQAGNYTVDEVTHCSSDPTNDYSYTAPFTVGEGLGGSISVSPDPPVVSQPANLNVAPTGGNPGYTFTWDLNNDGTFGDATTHNPTYTFTTTGSHTVSVRITDTGAGGNPTHTTTVTRTINVVAPTTTTTGTATTTGTTTGPATTTTAAPPPCVSKVAFKLSEFTTTGCFTQISSSPKRWTTTSAVKLNGILLPDYGQTFMITGPTPGELGGHFSAPNSTMQLDGFTVFSGNIDWSLPDGGPGQELVIPGRSFTVASGATLLGLHVRGSIALKLGADANVQEDANGYQNASGGTYYADLPLNIELPVGFAAGPDPAFGSVTGDATLRVDDAGIHYDGLKLQAHDVWLGKLKVHSICFSYIPSGGVSTTPCDPPSFGGKMGPVAQTGGDQPFIQCKTDATTNRWDASAEIEVPSGLQLGAFGGLADGQLSKLGASVGNLGKRVPLGYGFYLDKVAFGLCLSPPPFKIRANVGANFLGASNFVNIEGGFTYTDAVGYDPWSLVLDGSVSIGEAPHALPIGSGTFGFNGNGVVDFSLTAGVDVLGGFASFNAKVFGWVDAPHARFVVGGSGQGCFAGACASAEGELSSTGIAGCVTTGYSLPSYDLIIPLDGSGPPYLDTSTYPLTAGFGYDWGASSGQLLGGSCDFSSYEPAGFTANLAAAASSRLRLRVAHGTQAVALRIHGTHGPPKIVLHGPRGVTISSPSNARAKLSKGHYLLAENTTDGTTNVMLVRPAAGTWTVSKASGSVSSPTRIDRASLEVPPTLAGRVLGKSGTRTLRVAYAVPVGTSIELRERAKGVNHTIAKRLGGQRCPGLPKMRPHTNEKILCASIRFRPSQGRGGTRKVEAVVTRHGIPLLVKNIASFRVPRLTLPSRVGELRAQRGKGYLLIAFSPSSGAARYSVSAKLSDGPERAFDLGGRCRALRIANVPTTVAAAVKIAGVRFDLGMGRSRAISIKANARSAGPTSKKLRLGKVCT